MRGPSVALLLLVLATGAVAETAGGAHVVEAPRIAVPVTIDGDPSEWKEQAGTFAIDSPDQSVALVGSERAWDGPEDASGTFHVAVTDRALLLGGRIVDDVLYFHPRTLWEGDAIEVFVDTNPSPEKTEYDESCFQLVLAPLLRQNRWTVIKAGRRMRIQDLGWDGIRVEGRETTGETGTATGYEFELEIPLVNFPGLRVSAGRRIGFNVALVDAEPGPGQKAYLTWNGQPRLVDSPDRFGELVFPRGLQTEPRSTAPTERSLWRPALIVVVALALLILVVGLRRWLLRVVRLPLRVKLLVAAGLAVLYLLTLVAPLVADRGRRAARREELRASESDLARVRDEAMEHGIVRTGGFDEDLRALLHLLRGATVSVPIERDTVALWAREPEPGRTIVDPSVPFLDYGLPVPSEAPLVIPVSDRLVGRSLALVVSYELAAWARPQPPTGRSVARVEALFENGTTASRDLVYEEQITDALLPSPDAEPVLGDPDVRLAWRRTVGDGDKIHAVVVPLEVPPDAHASPLSRLEVQALGADGRLVLHAVTVIGEEMSQPVALGGRSTTGTRYRGWRGQPPGSEVHLKAGDEPVRLEVPATGRRFDRAWILLGTQAGYEPRRHERPVARVRIFAPDGGEAVREVELRSGIHLGAPSLFTPELPTGMESRLAFHWGTQYRVEVEVELDPPGPIARIEVEHEGGPEEVIVAGVTLGTPRPPPRPAESELLEAAEPGRVRLSDAGRRAVAGYAGFAVLSRGRVLDALSSDAAADRRLRGSGVDPEVLGTLREEPRAIETRESGDTEVLLLWIPAVLPGDALAGWVRFEPAGGLHEPAFVVGLVALALLLPIALLAAIDVLGRLRRLRLKLVLAFGMASLVPLLLLFFIVQRVFLTPFEERRRETLGRRVAEVTARLSRLVDQVGAEAERCSRDERLRSVLLLEDEALRDLEDEALRNEEMTRRLRTLARDIDLLSGAEPTISLEIAVEGSGRGPRLLPDRTEEPMLLGWTSPRSDLVHAWSHLSLKGVGRGVAGTVRWTLVVDVPVDRALLEGLRASLGGRLELLLYSPRGVPLAGTLDQAAEGSRTEVRFKGDLAEEIRRSNAPVVREVDGLDGRYLVGYDLVKDRGSQEVALLGAAEPQKDVMAARAQIRDLFVGLVVIALLLELLIGSLLTRRITEPILELERVVREVQRGNLEARAPSADLTDEVGALTRAFNTMADELAVRLGELHRLNDGIRRLTTHLERDAVVDASLQLLVEAAEPDGAALLLADRARGDVDLLGVRPARGGPEPGLHPPGRFLQEAFESAEPRLLVDLSARSRTGLEAALLRGVRSALLLPLTLGEEVTGVALLLYREPLDGAPDNLPFLSTVAGQVAVALENARLYRLAIEDGRTGLYVHAYFMARLGEEVDRALSGDRPLSLLVGAVDHFDTIVDRYGADEAQRVFQEVVNRVRGAVRRMYLMGRVGRDGIEILLPEADKRAALAVAVRVRQAVGEAPVPLGEDGKRELKPSLSLGLASCPEDAKSSEFLLSEAERALRKAQEDREEAVVDIETETKRLAGAAGADVGGYVFRSEKMIEILETVDRISRSDISILLRGETGVGKEVIAELLHRRSHRRDQPHVNVNCAALPETLLESELFGHERGAFTGADRKQLGRFEAAHGGTIFLDEIGEMSPSTQVKILRVLQDKTIERLGGRTPRKVDVRIVAATNRDLPEMIAQGTFREDLYFRLNVVSIVLPPLRQRKEEIPAFVDRFMREFNLRHETGVSAISPETMDVLYRHSWPGNVRELKNTIERAMVIADGETIRPVHLRLETKPGLVDATDDVVAPVASHEDGDGEGALSDRQVRILEVLRSRRTVSTREVAEIMNVSERTALRDLRDLIERGHVEKSGSRRAALYRLRGE